MATLNVWPTNAGGHAAITVTVNFWESGYDVNANTSSVGFEVILSKNAWATNWTQMGTKIGVTVTCEGQSQTVYCPNYNYNGKNKPGSVFGSGTFYNIGHNPDGSKSASIGISAFDNSGASYGMGSASTTGSIGLTTIPRASQPSISANPTSGSAITIYTNRASSGFTHTIQYFFGNASGTIATGVGDSCSWTPSHDLCQQIPNSASGNGTIRCLTYSGGTHIGTKDVGFTLTAAGSLVPTISASSIAEANSEVSSKYSAPTSWANTIHVKGKSYPSVTCTAAGIQGSTISKYALLCYTGSTLSKTIEAASVNDLNSLMSTQFDRNTQYTYKVRVTDTRGRTAIGSALAFVLLDYSSPAIGVTYSAERCDSSGALKDEGTYLKLQFSGSISSLSNNNPMTVAVDYNEVGQTAATQTYVNANKTVSSFDYTGNSRKILSKTNGFDINKSYDITFKVSDIFTTVTRTVRVSTSFVLIDFRANGHGIGIGKASENDRLEINMPIYRYRSGVGYEVVDTSTLGSSLILAFPVGSIYLTAYPASPSATLGGTWTQLKNRYLFATNATSGNKGKDAQSTTTGANTQSHTLTANQSGLREHSHGMNGAGGHNHVLGMNSGTVAKGSNYARPRDINDGAPATGYTSSWVGDHTHGIHNNGPWNAAEGHSHGVSYIEVYVWQRTA